MNRYGPRPAKGAEYRFKVPGPDGDREHVQVVPPREMPPLEDYIQEFLTPLRRVRIAPFLLEVAATFAGIRHLEPGDPNFDPSMADQMLPGIGGGMRFVEGRRIQYRRDRDGTLRVWEERRITHAEILAAMAPGGFRLSASDEWEYACGAGSRTLFRWGDHSPAEFYHTGLSVFSGAEWREAMEDFERYVELQHRLQDAPRGYDDPSTIPNAFGLLMTDGSNDPELCQEPGIQRGGDGGYGACGGMDLFTACWLPQATAFFIGGSEENDSGAHTGPRVRRAFPLVGRV